MREKRHPQPILSTYTGVTQSPGICSERVNADRWMDVYRGGESLAWLKGRERPLLRTHEPPFKDGAYAIGQLVEIEGRLYRVTRWEELRPVSLERGGSLKEWQVWGCPLSKKEMRDEVLGEARCILEEEEQRGSGPDN